MRQGWFIIIALHFIDGTIKFSEDIWKNFLQKHLVKLKKLKKFSYLNKIGSQSVQDVTDRIDRAFQLFFRNVKRKIRCSPPNFKKVKNYKSFTLKQSSWKVDEENFSVTINGQKFKYFQSRKISGKIKTVTIKRDSLGDLYVYFVTNAKIFDGIRRKRHNQPVIFCQKFKIDCKSLQKFIPQEKRFNRQATSKKNSGESL